MSDDETYTLQWEGLAIEVLYCAKWSDFYEEIYGYCLAHLQIRGPQPLPMTETGYRSHFGRADKIEAAGGPVAFVQAWLDHEAQSPAWKAAQEQRQQLSLF